jgi:hypothetical protein
VSVAESDHAARDSAAAIAAMLDVYVRERLAGIHRGLAVFLSASVWRETFDLPRGLIPLFTAIAFAVLTSERGERRPLFTPRVAAG